MAVGDWMKDPQNLASIGHALGGYAVILTAGHFGSAWVVLSVQALLALYVLVKEYWFDLHYESGETFGSSTIDALGYLIGSALAWGALALRWFA